MKATHIGKTIIVWDKLSDMEAQRVITALQDIIINYRQITKDIEIDSKEKNRPIPIILKDSNQFLCIMKKHKEILISAVKGTDKNNKTQYLYNAILNADYLFKSIDLLEDTLDDMTSHARILQQFPDTEWIQLPFSEEFNRYSLSPNINPEDFIDSLLKGNLSEIQKSFLHNVGLSLTAPDFSASLQQTIHKVNQLFEDKEI